ncbi:CPSF A subunit region-domain-containing protein [Flagelloscypha sp. PMI_526]|nr:CPSF A subunit region-domain-containing protein [Flagelloscypha sp. PMI_526]
MHALHQDVLPPSGVEHGTTLKLTNDDSVLYNLVVARGNLLRIFAVVEHMGVLANKEGVREREVDMEDSSLMNTSKSQGTERVLRFQLIREHTLHGIVTGLHGVKVLLSADDGLDRLLVSFKEAKIALLEWSPTLYDLQTVSIHTYERAPQLMDPTPSFVSVLRLDPQSRCAALSLPQDAVAILPFHHTQNTDLDADAMDTATNEIPYSPSFILDLGSLQVHHAIAFDFLPGFQKPTLAVLYQSPNQTWTGRLKEFKDTCSLVFFTLDVLTREHAVIGRVEGLPFDSLNLIPCAASIGGVIVSTSNSVIYANASRKLVLPVNGWPTRISDLPVLPVDDPTRMLRLEGSQFAFIDDRTLLVCLPDGHVYSIEVVAEGVVTKLNMTKEPIVRTTIPSGCIYVDADTVAIFSTVGPTVFMQPRKVQEDLEDDEEDEAKAAEPAANSVEMDVDEYDEELYGPLPTSQPSAMQEEAPVETASVKKKRTRTVVTLSLLASLPAYGPISDMVFGATQNGDKYVPVLITATGNGHLGSLSLFQKDLPVKVNRRPHAVGGMRGIWSLPIRPSSSTHDERDTLIISTDATPSPGVSRISVKGSKTDVTVTTRISGLTIGAAPFFSRTAILHVMTNAIRVLAPDGVERQIIKDLDGTTPRAKIRFCSIQDPFVLIFREDDTIGLFVGEKDRGKIRRKDMSMLGDKGLKYVTGCFFRDDAGIMPSSSVKQWLLLVRAQGTMEIWSLPKLALVFSSDDLQTLQSTLKDSFALPASSIPTPTPNSSTPVADSTEEDPMPLAAPPPTTTDVDQVLVAPVGDCGSKSLCLFVLLKSGHFAAYNIAPAPPSPPESHSPRTITIPILFVKAFSRAFELQRLTEDQMQSAIIVETKKIVRSFISFETLDQSSGVFFTGENPHWILKNSEVGALRMIPSGHTLVHAFSPCTLWGSKRTDFLLYSDEGANVVEWLTDFTLAYQLPSKHIPRGHAYSNIVFDERTSSLVAATNIQSAFSSYDEEGNPLWTPDASNVSYPTTDCSTLELINTESWITMDGFEFAQNEFVTSVAIVMLETSSTGSGYKELVAVATAVNRGEDLATKGVTYLFEIVEVVPDPARQAETWYKLKLRCKDEARGPVTALCGLGGYLVSSMGQKVFVRSFDQDERLVGVAFLDAGVYVTSLKVLKNLLLVGDIYKSVMFVAFQEEPFKLVVLAKDRRNLCVSCADFFFVQDEMAVVACDDEGVIRVYDYNPADPGSQDGRYLLLRSEFFSQSEYRTSVVVARRTKEDPILPQSKLLMGLTNGALSTLIPLDELTAKSLQLLYGQLARNVQHVAGLNPKANRIVRNDTVSKPLSKGVLDGTLLYEFENLSLVRQDEIVKQIGTEKTVLAQALTSLASAW